MNLIYANVTSYRITSAILPYYYHVTYNNI